MSSSASAVRPLLAALAFLATTPLAHAASPHLVVDLVSGAHGSGDSHPGAWVEAGEHTFFIATDHLLGEELFVTDGTPGGTRLLADTSTAGTAPFLYGVGGGRLFWWAGLGRSDQRFGLLGTLWASDGTPSGTLTPLPASAFIPGGPFPHPRSAAIAAGVLYFGACEGESCSLWRSDGTPDGTWGIFPHGVGEVAAVGDRVFFVADDDLWTLEPGDAATLLLSGAGLQSTPHQLTAVGTKLFFHAESDDGALWVSDGTAAGTQPVPVPELLGVSYSGLPWKASGDHLYFVADAGDGYEIWRSDGAGAGTGPATDFEYPYPFDLVDGEGKMVVVGTRLFTLAFSANSFSSRSLWTSDGSPGSTEELLGCGDDCSPILSDLAVAGGRVVLVLQVGDRIELWASDGTRAGTGPLVELCDSLCWFEVPLETVGSEVALTAGGQVWVTDGTVGGTRAVGAPEVAEARGAVARAGGCWVFPARDHRGFEPWCSEGSADSMRLLLDVNNSAPSSEPERLTAIGDRVVFAASDATGARHIWASDGMPGFAESLTATSGVSGTDRDLTGLGEVALFFGPPARSLWRTDGTVEGTAVVGDLDMREPVRLQGRIYVFGQDGSDSGIWEVTGDAVRLAVPLPLSPSLYSPVALGDAIYFRGTGDALWRTDGTTAGTWRVAAMPEAASLAGPPVLLDGLLYFVAYRPSSFHEDEIWESDGSPDSGSPVAAVPEIRAPALGGAPLHVHGNALFFGAEVISPVTGPGGLIYRFVPSLGLEVLAASTAYLGEPSFASAGPWVYFPFDDALHGRELWRSDGTEAGTTMVADLHVGGSSYPTELAGAGDRLFFAAWDAAHGRELWVVNASGSVALVSDIAPGAFSSDPKDLTLVGNTLFFTADDGHTGRELWALPEAAFGPPPPPVGPYLSDPDVPGFRFKVRITNQLGDATAGGHEGDCIAETLCVSGALAGRSEAFLRVVGPKPNGKLWPTLVKFSTSRVEVWVEQTASGELRYYDLAAASPGVDVLPGLFDRDGFAPQSQPAVGAASHRASARGAARQHPLPALEPGEWVTSPELPGFRVRVAIANQQEEPSDVRVESDCISETLCFSGAVPGRSELFIRIVGPKPNGHLWPTLVRFSTSTIDVWLEQIATGVERHYRLDGASPGSSDLSGRFDRLGFLP